LEGHRIVNLSAEIPSSPPADLRFRRPVRPLAAVRELWQARELLRALVERQLRSRYKQAFLGFAWALIPPVTMMLVLSLFVQRAVRIETQGVPYPLFSYVALLAWNFFANAVSGATGSLLGNIALLNKVYCPREVFPLSSTVTAAVDATIGLSVLAVLFVVHTFVPKETVIWVPVLLAVLVAFTLGVGLIMSSLVVYLRDLRHVLPMIIQLGLLATPIAYGMNKIPPNLRVPYSAVNPLAPVIDGLRRTMLLGQQPAWDLLAAGATTSFLLLGVGFILFKKLETGFTDVA
jgi:ABC-type polysaccharide/polyol phosphate export permease